MFMAENSGITPDDLEKLFFNGFDSPEAFSMVTPEVLQQLGVTEDTDSLLQKINDTIDMFDEL